LRRALVWVAAYLFLLQTTLAPMLVARVATPDLNQAVLVLCSGHTAATDGIPSKAHDTEDCKLCAGCGLAFVIGARQSTIAWTERPFSVSVGWSAIENPVPGGIAFFGKRARGPPLLT
jgi:hypothetical protein